MRKETDSNGNTYYNDLNHLHREDGPAAEYANRTKSWYLNGYLHRENGPAVEWANGSKEYWLLNIKYTEKDYLQQLKLKGFW